MDRTHADGQLVEVLEADLDRREHQGAVVELLDAYAQDPMGDGKPLSVDVKQALIPGLRQHPTTLIFIGLSDERPVGIATCFRGFSTFAARPTVQISDLFVLPGLRGKGIGRLLLAAVEQKARDLGCCKVTLEVQENNRRAGRLYAEMGFSQAVYVAAAGGCLHLTKHL